MIKLVAFDLDGTLTNEDKIITRRTFNALMKLQQQGVRLCLASGRPPYGMAPLCQQLRMHEYGGLMLAYNGGHIEDCYGGRVYVEKSLDETLLPELYTFQNESGMTLMTYYGDAIYTEQPDNTYVQISARNNKMRVEKVDDFVRDIPRPVNKCLMVGDPAIVPYWEETMQKAMQGRMNICRSTPYFIELLPLGIDKGSALQQLLPQLEIDSSQMMTFGDSYNDISMLEAAGIGVAMGNAEEAVKAVAQYVTLSNDDDGVAHALEHYGLV